MPLLRCCARCEHLALLSSLYAREQKSPPQNVLGEGYDTKVF